MTVRPDHSRGRFWVASQSEADHEHLVDLTAHKGAGECGCDQWKFRIQPLVTRGKPGRCRHIDAARAFLKDLIRSDTSTQLRPSELERAVNEAIRQWVEEEA